MSKRSPNPHISHPTRLALPAPSAHKKFPQYTRFFSAPILCQIRAIVLPIGLWIFLAATIYANIALFSPQSIKSLQQAAYHLKPVDAVRNVLGVSVEPEKQKEANTKKLLEKEYQHWRDVINEHPDYRDGYVALVTLSYQLGLRAESQKYLATVRTLDPNYPGITTLEALLAQNK